MKLLKPNDPKLHEKAIKVTKFDSKLRKKVEELNALACKTKNICGFSSIQAGVKENIILIYKPLYEGSPITTVMINTEILEEIGEQEVVEGCLSVPGTYMMMKRAERVRVKYQDVKGDYHVADVSGFPCAVILHEYDHSQGLTLMDREELWVAPAAKTAYYISKEEAEKLNGN